MPAAKATKKPTTARVAVEDLTALVSQANDLLGILADLRAAEDRATFVDNADHRAALGRDARAVLTEVLYCIGDVVDGVTDGGIDSGLLAEVAAP